ncbi:ROK family protein [Dehalococcoidia bacterium]|nr:ROK family protein [Dehalococcoidia bacterium]
MNGLFVVAVDIGGTSFRVALADREGRLLARGAEPTRPQEGPGSGIQRLKDAIRKTASSVSFKEVAGIAVGAAGPIDPLRGVILTPPSLPTWRDVRLKEQLEEEFQVPIWMENDADLAALGEHRFGAGRGCDRLIYITVSTGIGGGIIINGEFLRGGGLSVAEIGHVVVDPDGPVCNCGGRGHLEAVASGTAIARMAVESISQGHSSAISRLVGGHLSMVTAETVVEAAGQGDVTAQAVMQKAGTSLGIAVVSLIHIFDPEVVIIGGGVSNAGELILNPIRQVITERAMPDFRNRARVVRSSLGDNSVIFGAVALALEGGISHIVVDPRN